MKCSDCNLEIPDSAKFCSHCGNPVPHATLVSLRGSDSVKKKKNENKDIYSMFKAFLEKSDIMNIDWAKDFGVWSFIGSIFLWFIFCGLLNMISSVLGVLGGMALCCYGICYVLKNNPTSRTHDRWTAVFLAAYGVLTIYVSTGERSHSNDNSDIRDAVEMLNEVKGKSFPEAIRIWHEGK